MPQLDAEAALQVYSRFFDHWVRIGHFGEHHMGAEHVCIWLDRAFDGVDQFHSTNGHAQFSVDSAHLIVYDATIILLLDYSSGRTYHMAPPNGCYFTNQAIHQGHIQTDLYGGRSCRPVEPVALIAASNQMRAGLGPASNGIMPSAHLPYLEALRGRGRA